MAARCSIGHDERVPDERTLTFEDNEHLRELVGEFGAHLKMIAGALAVEVAQRGNTLRITAAGGEVEPAVRLLQALHHLVRRGHPLHTTDVDHAIRILRSDPKADLTAFFADTILVGVGNRPITPRSVNQRRYVEALRRSDIVFGVGPAGTGKTYLAVAVAVAALIKGEARRVVLTRPAVEAGEKLGFLPGDLAEKVDPYLRPLFDALNDMLPGERVTRLFEKRVIEVAPLAFMRGRTLNGACVILDEAQNTTIEQMKMFLTRLGEGSRMVVTGDITQIDLPSPRRSGLVNALDVLGDVEGIDVVRFTREDVVRHPLVAAIIDAYERGERAPKQGNPRLSEPEP